VVVPPVQLLPALPGEPTVTMSDVSGDALATIVANLLPSDFADPEFGKLVINAGRKVLNGHGVKPTFGDSFNLHPVAGWGPEDGA